jgi:hypothetical protein
LFRISLFGGAEPGTSKFDAFFRPILLLAFVGNNNMKKDEMVRACSTHGEKMNMYRVSVRKPEGRRLLGRP